MRQISHEEEAGDPDILQIMLLSRDSRDFSMGGKKATGTGSVEV